MRRAWLVLGLAGCVQSVDVAHLDPTPNPLPLGRGRAPQPWRDHPRELAVSGDGAVWVTLQGSRDEPGTEVLRIGPGGHATRQEIGLSGPTGAAVHPDGRWMVVLGRFSDALAVVDTDRVAPIAYRHVGFYAQEAVFGPDGSDLWLTRRWPGRVERWTARSTRGGLELRRAATVAEVASPRDLALSEDGWLAVGSPVGTELVLADASADRVVWRVPLGSPANGLAFAGKWLVVATTGPGTGHRAAIGFDGDGDGLPGDGTEEVSFGDLDNQLVVIDPARGEVVHRYDAGPGGLVGGALPEQLASWTTDRGHGIWVGYSGSNQLQRFDLDPSTGALSARPPLAAGGHEPQGLAIADGRLWVSHRLGDSVEVRALEDGAPQRQWQLGVEGAPPFPATDAEIGELLVSVTGPISVDGDQTCAHCHPRGSAVGRVLALPGAARPESFRRVVLPAAGLADTEPWFSAGLVDHTDFVPISVRSEDADGALRSSVEALVGRTTSFGDVDGRVHALDQRGIGRMIATFLVDAPGLLPNPEPAPTELVRRGKALFERADVGCVHCHPPPSFAVSETHNPSGLPLRFPSVVEPPRDPEGVNLDLLSPALVDRFPRVRQDRCAELCPPEDCARDPSVCDDLREVFLGVPSLRGLWDRTGGFLHDGRASSLREVVCPPGHPALGPTELGHNSSGGRIDTHGGTSHLTVAEIEALLAYLRTL